MRRILLVEDEPAVASVYQRLLGREGYQVSVAGTLADAKAAARALPPADLIVLDIELPDGNGLDLAREVRARKGRTPIIVLTGKPTEEHTKAAFAAGADQFASKAEALPCIAARVHRMLGASPPPGPNDSRIEVNWCARTVHLEGQSATLTPKEAELLRALMEAAPEFLSTGELQESVWLISAKRRTATVRVHVRDLRRKLESVGLKGVISTVRNEGYAWAPYGTGNGD